MAHLVVALCITIIDGNFRYNARPSGDFYLFMELTMNKRELHCDLLHSGKYRQQIVKAKKGKGAFSRHEKHKKHRSELGGVFLFLWI